MILEKGKKAPTFTLPDREEKEISLADLKGKWVCLYFYPRDMTPGCTTQACSFRDNFDELKKAGVEVIGISADSPQKHEKFVTKYELPFTLLSDEDKKVCEAYGVWQLKKFMGKEFMGIVRTTFLIDKDGNIAHVFTKPKVATQGSDVLEVIRTLE